MLSVITLFLCIIFASALFSMSEAAILSLPLVRARVFYEQKKPNAKDLLYIKENINEVNSSVVVANNIINIVGSMFVGNLVTEQYGNQWLGLASAVLSFFIIIASEIIPKTIGERYKVTLSLMLAKPLRWLHFVFKPIVSMIFFILKPIMKETTHPRVTEEEIKMMLKFARAEGTVEMDEELLCSRVFKLNDVRAAQIMKPVDQIYSLPANKTLGDLKDQIVNSRFSRIVVYDKNHLDIVGTVQHRTLLREIAKDNYTSYIRDYMTEPIFVNWFTKADDLLEKFQAYHTHLFITKDSQGKVVGIVTMEDVLEELFGEIYDEKDVVKPKVEDNPEEKESKLENIDVEDIDVDKIDVDNINIDKD